MNKKLLTSLFLLPLLASCSIVINHNYTYNDADKYSEYVAETFIETEIKELSIDWVNGSVTIRKGESFSFSEESKSKPLYYWCRDNKLDIKYFKSGTESSEYKDFFKPLVVTVPYNLEKLNLDIVNGSHQIQLDTVNQLSVEAVNGSGNIELDSSKNINVNVTNGMSECTVYHTSIAEIYDFKTVNGSVTLNVDRNRDFDVSFKATNGILVDNFTHPEVENNKYKVNFKSTNGSFTINGISLK